MANQTELVEQLFEAVLPLNPTERRAFLDQECRSAPELRRTVEELLARMNAPAAFLSIQPWIL